MYKGHFYRIAFIETRVAQLVVQQATNLKVAGSRPTVGKTFSFCILLLATRSWQLEWSNTISNEIKHDIYQR